MILSDSLTQYDWQYIRFEPFKSTDNSSDMHNLVTEENSPRSSSMGSSPNGSSTSSKHSRHTLEQSNTISYDLVAQNLRTEPPRKRLKTNESETAHISPDIQLDELTGNTVDEEELNFLIPIFENDPIDLEDLRLKLNGLGINSSKLPAEEDFLTTENMFNSQDVNFPVNMKSISTYQLNQNLTLTIGIVILTQLIKVPNGIISLEDAKEYNLYEGIIDEWSKYFNIENIYFISLNMQIFAFIESTLFPYWRYRSFMDVSYPMEWRNGFKIQKPNERTSTIWPWSSII